MESQASNHETIVAQQNHRVDWRDRDLCASGSTFSLDSFRDACGQRNYPPSKFAVVAGGPSGHKGAHSGTVTHRHRVLTLLAPPKLLSST